MIDKEAAAREQPSKAIGVGNVVDVAVSTEDCQYKRKDSRVTWNDNHGKELAKIWEFELRYGIAGSFHPAQHFGTP